jgi:3-phenylpropionate/cinnamic acid dioxygenase small subunit
MTALDVELLKQVEQFVYMEARLQDEHQYDAWEALWADDAIYWVPANADDIDPTTQMSIIFDNRSRISTRIRQLHTGKRHAQNPASRLRHLISNVELLGSDDESGEVEVGANFLVYESRDRGVTLWAGRHEWTLRRTDDGDSAGTNAFKIARKKVTLVNNDRALSTLAFLI